ncbi:hypothetical protein [Lichenihabitans psoromatis]|uniref:hypothetical protein n=1 Tax=Lichenihabitans psoromatis TaxID=2528642 RepID=UPI0010385C45|nr:hypothetical protein [Lichenihabitans psoromatis]
MIYRKKPDVLGAEMHAKVLADMKACRKTLLVASQQVHTAGDVDREIDKVRRAIDGLATYLTGNDAYFALPLSQPGKPWWTA